MGFPVKRFNYLFITSACLIAILGMALTIMNKQKYAPRYEGLERNIGLKSHDAAGSSQGGQSMEVIVVSLTPEGFVPREVYFPRKRFVLAINNRTGLNETALDLFWEKTNKVQGKKLGRETMSLQWELELQQGDYELHDTNHSNWVLTLTGLRE